MPCRLIPLGMLLYAMCFHRSFQFYSGIITAFLFCTACATGSATAFEMHAKAEDSASTGAAPAIPISIEPSLEAVGKQSSDSGDTPAEGDDIHPGPFDSPPQQSVANELLVDTFSDGVLEAGAWLDDDSSRAPFWTSIATADSVVAEIDDRLKLTAAGNAAQPQAGVTGKLRPELDIFRSHHEPVSFIVTTLAFSGSATSDAQQFSLAIVSQPQKRAWQADDALVLEVNASGALKLLAKGGQPNSAGAALLDTMLAAVPRGFCLTLDETSYTLEVYWPGGWTSFSGKHGLRKERWDGGGAASAELLATRIGSATGTVVVSVGSLRVVQDMQLGSEGGWSEWSNMVNYFPPAYILANGYAANPDIQRGYLPVTLYGADPTGQRDSTAQIQRAIDDAYYHSLICFFPAGTYRVSKQLIATQRSHWIATTGRWKKVTSYANLLVGSRQGARPVLKLIDRSPDFGDASKPRAVVRFTSERSDFADASESAPPRDTNQPNINFNQLFKGIDIDLGAGNLGATGLVIESAQGTTVEDVKVMATGAYAGLAGGSGAGGGWFNVEVVGGQYGMRMNSYATEQMLTVGTRLYGQQEAALFVGGFGVAVVVGADIRKEQGAAILIDKKTSDNEATLSLVDARVRFNKPGAMVVNPASKSLYLRNVNIFNAEALTRHGTQSTAGSIDRWVRIRHHAHNGKTSRHVVDGVVSQTDLLDIEKPGSDPGDLVKQHLYPADIPSFEDVGIVNVKTDLPPKLRARGDGRTDDTAALQYAIDHYQKIFLPKGVYLISRTLTLGAETQFIGASKIHTIIAPDTSKWNPKVATPLIATVDDADARTILASVQTQSLQRKNLNFSHVLWRAGRHSIMKDTLAWAVNNKGKRLPVNIRAFTITGKGGGRFYNAFNLGGLTWVAHDPDFRRVLVDGTKEPITIYSFNPEGSWGDYKSEFRNARNIQIYGVKDERGPPTALFVNCDNVSLIGHGGAVHVLRGVNHDAVYELINTNNVELGGLFRWYRYPKEVTISDRMVYEDYGSAVTTVHFSNMVSYFRRGKFTPFMTHH